MTFDYHRPNSLEEATRLLGQEGAVTLAGGTDLLVSLRHRTVTPSAIVDLKGIGELSSSIEPVDARIQVGSRVVMRDITMSPLIRRHLPALGVSAEAVGSVQIRNRATLAGNLCNASPAADTVPALLAYGASVRVSGIDGERKVPVAEFFTGPGTTVLTRDEIVTSVEIPLPQGRCGSAFARVTRRKGVDLASVSVACAVDADGNVRFGLGAVGPTPIFAESTIGELSSEGGWEPVLSKARPISDVRAGADYRRAMLWVHSRRISAAARRERAEASCHRGPGHRGDRERIDQAFVCRPGDHIARSVAGAPRPDRCQGMLCRGGVRCMHGSLRRPAGQLMPHPRRGGRRCAGDDDRGSR